MAGEKQGSSKLTTEQVLNIRSDLEQGIEGSVLAEEHDVARTTISKIKYRKRWGHV